MPRTRLPSKDRIGIIFNPLGGRNKREGPEEIWGLLSKVGELKSVSTPKEIRDALICFEKAKKSWILISGGDGTVQMVLTALFHKRPFFFLPRLSVLPGGTTNLIAGDLGLMGSQKRAIKRLSYMLEDKDETWIFATHRDVLRLSREDGLVRYGMFLGGGLVSEGVALYEKDFRKRTKGASLGIVLTVIKCLFGLFRQKRSCSYMEINVNNQSSIKGGVCVLLCTTLERLFLGTHPFWARARRGIRMSLLLSGARGLLRFMPYILSGRPHPALTPENGYFSCRFFRAEVRTNSPLALDGELITPYGESPRVLLEYGGKVVFLQW